MKEFIKKLSLFTLCLVTLLIGFHVLVSSLNLYPYTWGNPLYQEKLVDLEKHGNVNTYFIGSSHFYRQIIPDQFDLAVNKKSYNLGVQGLATPENYYLLENLLDAGTVTDATIFLALSDLQSIAPKNFYTSRSTYFINTKILKESLAIISNETNFSFLTKSFRTFSFLGNYLYNTLGLAGLRAYLRKADDVESSFLKSRGFLALDDDVSDEVQNRATSFKNELDRFNSRVEKTKRSYSNFEPNSTKYNRPHIDYLNSLIKKAGELGNDLVFIITPRKDNYSNVLNLAAALPKNSVIDLANPIKYPEFYAFENSFDIGHLNKKGAIIFTEALAKEYLKIKNL